MMSGLGGWSVGSIITFSSAKTCAELDCDTNPDYFACMNTTFTRIHFHLTRSGSYILRHESSRAPWLLRISRTV